VVAGAGESCKGGRTVPSQSWPRSDIWGRPDILRGTVLRFEWWLHAACHTSPAWPDTLPVWHKSRPAARDARLVAAKRFPEIRLYVCGFFYSRQHSRSLNFIMGSVCGYSFLPAFHCFRNTSGTWTTKLSLSVSIQIGACKVFRIAAHYRRFIVPASKRRLLSKRRDRDLRD
jgi:hypothetical protein